MPDVCMILNERAGNLELASQWLEQEVQRRNIVTFRPTDLWGAVDALYSALRAGFRRLIIAGGDGTISKLVNALAGRWDALELAVLPVGTGNDWARTLGLPVDDLAACLDVALEGRVRPTDLIHIAGSSPEYCVNAATAGVGARVAADVRPEDKQRWGSLAYWLTAVSHLAQWREYQVQVDWDDASRQLSVWGLVVANGMYAGGGFPIAPKARPDDGLLDITLLPALPWTDILVAGLAFSLGASDPQRIPTMQARRVHIHSQPALHFSIDGEPTRAIDTTFEVLPGVLHVVRP
ncbi:MAG: hypothetical protein KatS3mg110_3250 [Pirellulaceae bacterium]|nr:MAG: hypothetical protein KatS3mg110_3250 [Pirellulaceae bacterium]